MRVYRGGGVRPGRQLQLAAADIEDAIELANGPSSASAPTPGRATRPSGSAWSRELAAGMVFINGNVTSYPQLPFGGVKRPATAASCRIHGIREFCNIKSVWIGG